jgi:hypothetical protein
MTTKKILLTNRPGGAWGYITDGFANALKDKGHIVRRYDNQIQSWLSFQPDLYIGCSGHKQQMPEKHNAKIAIHVNPLGPIEIPGINENQQTVEWTLAQNPDVVFGYGFEQDKIYWDYWISKHNVKWVPLPTAGDKTLFKDLQKQRDLDVVYLGGRWAYKSLTIDSFLLPIIRRPDLKSELYGWGDWPSGVSKGLLPEAQVVEFLNRGLVGPCISEQHTQKFGIDLPERVWKLALCGVLAVHDPVPTMKTIFDAAHILMAANEKEYNDIISFYCDPLRKEERYLRAETQKQHVLNAHTYHHRLSDLFKSLGWVDEAAAMLA